MGGLLQPRWERRADELGRADAALLEQVAQLEREVASLSGRLRSCENSVAAANSRCERIETRLGKLEAQVLMPDMVERRFAPGDEDQEPPTKQKTCPTCRGAGHNGPSDDPVFNLIRCTSCDGRGFVEVVP